MPLGRVCQIAHAGRNKRHRARESLNLTGNVGGGAIEVVRASVNSSVGPCYRHSRARPAPSKSAQPRPGSRSVMTAGFPERRRSRARRWRRRIAPAQGEHLADQVPPPCRPAGPCRPSCDISRGASIPWWMLATGRRRGAEYVSNANCRNRWAVFL